MASTEPPSKIPRRPERSTQPKSYVPAPITAAATSAPASCIPRRLERAAQFSPPSTPTPKTATSARSSKIPRRAEHTDHPITPKSSSKMPEEAHPSKIMQSPQVSGVITSKPQSGINTPGGPTMSNENLNVNTVAGSVHTLNNNNNIIITNIYGPIPDEFVYCFHCAWTCHLLTKATQNAIQIKICAGP